THNPLNWFGGKGRGGKSESGGRGKKPKKSKRRPENLEPPPVTPEQAGGKGKKSEQGGQDEGQKPNGQQADQESRGAEQEQQANRGQQGNRPESGRTTGGNAGMGRIHEIAQELAEAIRRHPLENDRDMQTLLKDLGQAGPLIADAKTSLAGRVGDEFPAHAQVTEALESSSRHERTSARAAEGLHDLYKRKHNADHQRFEQPRTQEQKLDYEKNKDSY
ncbi:hypothetical protein, partial [Saccharopolyspora shandongensis]|uniref:hypothetical protein n=1 Tax=Saccharopolyspora shandongensis TaxID=418495 RepID=UPI0034778471